ncbi:MAG: FAD binding domain-containing protein [Gammaproteobacteria bacterium]
MKSFDYHKPSSVADAAKLLADGDAMALAGGMTLLPTMKQRLNSPRAVVDLSAIEALRGIRMHETKGLVVGAMATHAEVAASVLVRDNIPALAKLAGGIGDAQVRNCGTAGGSVANNDPAADYPAALLALGGSVHTNKREINADDFFCGLFATALEEDEIIAHLHLPVPQKAAYQKFAQPASLYALVGVFVAQTSGGVRVAYTGAGNGGVFRAPPVEDALKANFSPDAVPEVPQAEVQNLMSDMHGSAEYRASLMHTLTKRAVASCA